MPGRSRSSSWGNLAHANVKDRTVKLAFLAAFGICLLPGVCIAEDLDRFGLAGIEVLTDVEGHKIRGLGMFAKSTAASGVSMNIQASTVNSLGSSNWNMFSTSLNTSNDRKTTADITSEPNALGVGVEVNGLVGIPNANFSLQTGFPETEGWANVFIDLTGVSASSAGRAIAGANTSFLFNPL